MPMRPEVRHAFREKQKIWRDVRRDKTQENLRDKTQEKT